MKFDPLVGVVDAFAENKIAERAYLFEWLRQWRH